MNTTTPFNYPMCGNARCQKSAHCLRHSAHISCSVQQITTMYINPKLTDGDKDGCPYYRDANTVVYARGMKKFLGNLPMWQHNALRNAIKMAYCSTTFYKMKNGKYPISPSEQERIKEIADGIGIKQDIVYDMYFDSLHW